MICPRCGHITGDTDQFCPHCGAALGPQPAPWTAPPPPPARPQRHTAAWIAAGLAAVLVLAAGGITAAKLAQHHTIRGTARPPNPTTPLPPTHTVVSTATVTATPTPTPSATFATVYAREQSGVVRIETISCSDAGIGTGFLLSPTLVATVNHVIADAAVVSLIAGSQRTTGTVIGTDPTHDLALVRADRPLTGYHFQFATRTPQIGDQVGVIGFPIGNPITFTRGDISGLDRNINVDGNALTGMVETDAALNPGNSGGPMITQDGTVVGLIDAGTLNANGIGYAVPATQAAGILAGWQTAPHPVPPASCPNPLGPSQDTQNLPTPGQIPDSAATGIVAAFNTYFNGINTGNYAAAWAVLSPRLQAGASEQAFADGDATSFIFAITVLDAHMTNPATAQVALSFTSLQRADKGPGGDTCDVWTISYTLTQAADSSWLIDATSPYDGTPLHATC